VLELTHLRVLFYSIFRRIRVGHKAARGQIAAAKVAAPAVALQVIDAAIQVTAILSLLCSHRPAACLDGAAAQSQYCCQDVVWSWCASSDLRIRLCKLRVIGCWIAGCHHSLLVQIHGGAGVSQDVVLGHLWACARTLRIADGPDEVRTGCSDFQ